MTPDNSTAAGGYSEAEMIKMQRDAIRRVREMQQRARDFEQARRASAAQAAGEPLIPRPTLTSNPIGINLSAMPFGAQSAEEAQHLTAEAPPVERRQAGAASGGTQAGSAPGVPHAQTNARQSQGPRHSQPQAKYHGARQPAQAKREAAPAGSGLLGSLLGGNGLSGIGDSIGGVIGGFSQPVKSALDSLGLDNERLLIILVMFIVFTQEEYDNMLLLALGYLLF